MITSLNVPLSGMRHARAQIQANAHNTANTTTDSFARQQVTGLERPKLGVRSTMDTEELSRSEQLITESIPGPQNNVRAVEEIVNRIAAQRSLEVNARVVRTQDKMTQSVLDITA